MSLEQFWPWVSVLTAIIGVILGAQLRWWHRHREANLAMKRSVFRRIVAHRHRLQYYPYLAIGEEEPFLALNEAAFAFADHTEITGELNKQFGVAFNPNKDERPNIDKVLRMMATVCKFPIHKKYAFWENPVKTLKQERKAFWEKLKQKHEKGKERRDADRRERRDYNRKKRRDVSKAFWVPKTHSGKLTEKRAVFRRFVAYRRRLYGNWKLRREDVEPYMALDEAVATFSDCPMVSIELEHLHKAIQQRNFSNGDSKLVMKNIRDRVWRLYVEMAEACHFHIKAGRASDGKPYYPQEYLLEHPFTPSVHGKHS